MSEGNQPREILRMVHYDPHTLNPTQQETRVTKAEITKSNLKEAGSMEEF